MLLSWCPGNKDPPLLWWSKYHLVIKEAEGKSPQGPDGANGQPGSGREQRDYANTGAKGQGAEDANGTVRG